MLELERCVYTVVGYYGDPSAIDRTAEKLDLCVRVAADELMVLHDVDAPSNEVRSWKGLRIDLTAGFTVWAVRGEGRYEAMRRLSAVEVVPSCCIQGLVAHLPAKVIARSDEVLVVVPSVVSHHLRDRLVGACHDLVPCEVMPTPDDESGPV